MSFLALDIGGANIKAADGRGFARSVPFELWRNPRGLNEALDHLVRSCPAADEFAVTMTGELADCFSCKADGVRAIVDAAEEVARPRRIFVYLCDGRLVDTPTARQVPELAAASNWHALANFCSRFLSEPGSTGVLVDIGSTTSDLIPIAKNGPAAVGRTDTERLLSGELVYTGVSRSPVCSLVNELPWRGRQCPIAAEVFATTVDVYLTLGEIPEDPADSSTADGKPRTIDAARNRLARMICADGSTFSSEDAVQAAEFVRNAQLEALDGALRQVVSRSPVRTTRIIAIFSGSGEFLARRLLERSNVDFIGLGLKEQLGQAASACAPAHALAVLAAEAQQINSCQARSATSGANRRVNI